MTWWVQPAAGTIVLLYLLLQSGREASRSRFLVRLLLIGCGAFLAEESCIRLYSFYDYSDDWWVKVGHVPLLVLMIWPVVIHSAHALARQLLSPPSRPADGVLRVAIAAGLLVLTDAALIEPVSVYAGLWHWNEPGLFGVPPIGVIGWGLFAAICAGTFGWADKRSRVWDITVIPATLLGTHLLLLLVWWGGLRYVSTMLPGLPAAGVVIAISVALSTCLWRSGTGRRICRWDLLLRIPAALFFGALLITWWPVPGALFAYFLAFTPPYVVLTVHSRSAPSLTKESQHD